MMNFMDLCYVKISKSNSIAHCTLLYNLEVKLKFQKFKAVILLVWWMHSEEISSNYYSFILKSLRQEDRGNQNNIYGLLICNFFLILFCSKECLYKKTEKLKHFNLAIYVFLCVDFYKLYFNLDRLDFITISLIQKCLANLFSQQLLLRISHGA